MAAASTDPSAQEISTLFSVVNITAVRIVTIGLHWKDYILLISVGFIGEKNVWIDFQIRSKRAIIIDVELNFVRVSI